LPSQRFLVGSDTPQENVQLRGFIPLCREAVSNFAVHEMPGQAHFANLFAPE
jgi:hypothetical protein